MLDVNAGVRDRRARAHEQRSLLRRLLEVGRQHHDNERVGDARRDREKKRGAQYHVNLRLEQAARALIVHERNHVVTGEKRHGEADDEG
eukprot:5504732-Prymnesium_polylepis.1